MVKTTIRNAAGLIERREPFDTYGALSARIDNSLSFGYLPDTYVNALAIDRDQCAHNGYRLYVVYSYGTPIAWFNPLSQAWTIPGVKYSVTTSKHQGNLSRVMAPGTHRGMLGEDWGAKSA